jgi:hypothetical protein
MRRKHIAATTAITGIFGLVFVLFVLTTSLKPSALADAQRPSIKIDVNPGEFKYISDPTSIDQWPSQLLVLRKSSGELRVFRLSLLNGKRALPDKHWWNPAYPCEKLEPNFKSSTIECNEDPYSIRRSNDFRWNLDGKNQAPELGIDDMMLIEGKEANNEFVFTNGR